MKLLIVLIAMGVIGVIGTVEYSHAQTIMTIPPTNIPTDGAYAVFTIKADGESKYYLTADNRTIKEEGERFGAFYFTNDLYLKSNPVFPTRPNNFVLCTADIMPLNNTIIDQFIPNTSIPDNITPQGNDNITAIGINIYVNDTELAPDGTTEYKTPCQTDLEAQTDGTTPILTEKDLRVTLYGKHDKKPYYFSPRDNITKAQPIPTCTTDNFDTTTQTLKGTNNMCYGKNGNDMVIMTKRLLGFYGAAETITTPAKPVELNPATTPAQPDNTNDENISEQEKAYRELLKKLYLPAI